MYITTVLGLVLVEVQAIIEFSITPSEDSERYKNKNFACNIF